MSKTPKASDDEIALARNRSKKLILGLVAISFVVLPTVVAILAVRSNTQPCAISIPRLETGRVAFSDTFSPRDCVYLRQANTPALRTKGLSGTKNMASTEGMLFTFDEPGKHCMWMKDMYISLDMVWLNSEKVITEIKRDVRPETYPEVFCGAQSDKYVIELLSGTADRAGLQPGNKINL